MLLPMTIIGKYKCLKCSHEYEHPVRPTECPVCGHLYVKWLNYNELFGGRVLEQGGICLVKCGFGHGA